MRCKHLGRYSWNLVPWTPKLCWIPFTSKSTLKVLVSLCLTKPAKACPMSYEGLLILLRNYFHHLWEFLDLRPDSSPSRAPRIKLKNAIHSEVHNIPKELQDFANLYQQKLAEHIWERMLRVLECWIQAENNAGWRWIYWYEWIYWYGAETADSTGWLKQLEMALTVGLVGWLKAESRGDLH